MIGAASTESDLVVDLHRSCGNATGRANPGGFDRGHIARFEFAYLAFSRPSVDPAGLLDGFGARRIGGSPSCFIRDGALSIGGFPPLRPFLAFACVVWVGVALLMRSCMQVCISLRHSLSLQAKPLLVLFLVTAIIFGGFLPMVVAISLLVLAITLCVAGGPSRGALPFAGDAPEPENVPLTDMAFRAWLTREISVQAAFQRFSACDLFHDWNMVSRRIAGKNYAVA